MAGAAAAGGVALLAAGAARRLRLHRAAALFGQPPSPAHVTGSIARRTVVDPVKPVNTRFGQQVRNNLIFLFVAAQAEPAAPRYSLDLRSASISEASANMQVNDENEPTAAIVTVRAATS